MRDPAESAAAQDAACLEELDAVLAEVMRDTVASVGLLYLRAPGEQLLRLAVASGAPLQITAPWSRIPADAPIPVVDAIRQRRLVWLGSQEEVARRYPRLGLVLPYDFMLAAAPITSATVVWGGVVLLWPVWHPPQLSQREREAITACCHRAGQMLQHAAETGQPLVPPEEPRLLSPPPSRKVDPAEALAALEFTERLPVGCCALDLDGRITLINPAGADMVGAEVASLVGRRPWEVLLWLREPVFEDRYRAAVVTRQPTSFTAVRPPDQPLTFQLYPDRRGISVQITPAATGEATPATQGQHPPSAAGPVGAMALYHLTHLAAALTEAAGVGDVVNLAADQIVPGFGPKALALMTAEEGRLHITGYRGYAAHLMDRFDAEPLTSDTPAARVLATGRPSFFATFADLKRAYPPAVHQDEMAAWAFLPLIASGRTVGSLVLAYDHPRPFPPAERALLTSVAGLIAQALDRARLFDTNQQLAHTLQTGLLPHTLPAMPGIDVAARYQAAGGRIDIGGDFYDLIRCDAATAVATIGDVQGHNMNAAALMGQVRTAVHAHATAGTPPGEALARTNRLLTDLDPGLFTSCLYAHLDLAHHRAHLATAGHTPPLLRHRDGHTDVLDLPPGLLLGIDPDAEYPAISIPFPPGALLTLYTDGLVETPGTDIDDATTDLARQLTEAGHQSLDALADLLLRHAERTAPRNDDIALLLVRAQHGP
ncbi:SpoIIE family protein phosphatase [Streptomyces sp. HUAS MG47]|uniref:SpoIIE family protein phosphatase n=1 Tax=Streptomyces solicamelliae TaxID=3231716 RepID=UPI00387791DE